MSASLVGSEMCIRDRCLLESGWDTQRFPFGLVRDGDIWQLISEALSKRGVSTVRVTKVRGHATEEH
eukprot:11681827-Alexandrium_andersonii.AAC.1